MAEGKLIRKRLINSYLSGTISISLVLVLIGMATFLLVNAAGVSDFFKENLQISVLLKQEVTDGKAEDFAKRLSEYPYINSARVVSREEGTRELQALLGEDFLRVFESSPVPVSVDVTLKADWVSSDSLAVVIPAIEAYSIVDEVSCQESLVDALNSNLSRISAVLAVFVALLIFISYVLINNTVRLNAFARRFSIHTMKLVGATTSFIRRPFLRSSLWQALASAGVALTALSVIFCSLGKSFPALFGIFVPGMWLIVGAVVVASSVAICLVSTYFAINRLVSLTKDELYA